MKFGINCIDDFNIKGKTVLLRVDINQPIDKKTEVLKDITRIEACVPTICELNKKGAKLVILAHQGSDIEYLNYYNLSPHAKVLSKLIGKNVEYIPDVCGPYALERIKHLKESEILLLDNVRFMAEEMTLFETTLNLTPEQQSKTLIVSKLAPLADLFIIDAFAAAHRSQPTLVGFEQLLPSGMGRLFEKEYSVLSEILKNPKKPLIFILGGVKIQDAFMIMNKILKEDIAEKVLTGGIVAQVMLIAKGIDLGKPSYDFIKNNNLIEYIDKSKELLRDYFGKIILPVDLAYSKEKRFSVNIESLPFNELMMDIGDKTIEIYISEIMKAAMIFANGPVGVFEKKFTENGTKRIWQALGNTTAYTVIGGGDSITASNKYGVSKKIDYICTGGGAMVRFLSGEELPVVAALKNPRKQ